MKKNRIIIKTLISLMATGACMIVQAQQQKPSERSFAAEVNKIKEKQAARNTMIRHMQQPTGNTSVPGNAVSDQQVKSQDSKAIPATSSGNSTKTTQQNAQPAVSPGTQETKKKPSAGPMRQPRRPRVQ